MICWLSLPVV
jgi:hypothetical protein